MNPKRLNLHPMNTPDTYRTIRNPSTGIYRDRGSRFLSFAHPVSSADEVKSILESYRKEYHDARHHCYAYRIGYTDHTWRSNDDGEPSGTAGKPILGQINSSGLSNILIIVIRYFGGTLLGTSGLINAYKTASSEAIKNASICVMTVNEYWHVEFPYSAMNDVMKVLKEENAGQADQRFELNCSMTVFFRLSAKENILKRLNTIENLKAGYLSTR